MGVFVITLPIIISAVRDIVVAYLKRHNGRNVQAEFDGIKVKMKEPTAEEVDRVLNLVEEKSRQKHRKK